MSRSSKKFDRKILLILVRAGEKKVIIVNRYLNRIFLEEI